MRNTAILLTISLNIAPFGCGRPLTCSGDDCSDAEGLAEVDGSAPPDLPCSGADFQVDDRNCGSCGSVCEIAWADTPYSSGHCEEGKCSPFLDTCNLLGEQVNTCAQLCADEGLSCVARGCPGVQNEKISALLFMSMAGPCLPQHPGPAEERTQDCDEPIEYDHQGYSSAHCCCI